MMVTREFKKWWIAVIAVLLVGLLTIGYVSLLLPKNSGTYSVSDYADAIEIGHHPSQNYGAINGYLAAYIAGARVIRDCFLEARGSASYFTVDVSRSVYYDEVSDTWLLYLSPRDTSMFGGSYAVIIASDGTVLSCWGEA